MTEARRQLPVGMTPRLLSRDQAAAYCGVSPNHFEDEVAPKVPALQIGRRNLWDRKAIDAWLDRRSGLGDALKPIEDWLGALGNHDRET